MRSFLLKNKHKEIIKDIDRKNVRYASEKGLFKKEVKKLTDAEQHFELAD